MEKNDTDHLDAFHSIKQLWATTEAGVYVYAEFLMFAFAVFSGLHFWKYPTSNMSWKEYFLTKETKKKNKIL